jgi:hypothetical protein
VRLAVISLIACVAGTARAEPADPKGATGEPTDGPRPHFNLRVGGSTADDNRRPTICAEVGIAFGVSAEGCGTGSGFLHRDDGGEMAHFRAKVRIARRPVRGGAVDLALGAGFAELEVGRDDPGFDFGAPGGVEPTSVAGPESSISAQYLAPLGRGFELIANASVGLAYFRHAPELAVPQSRLQPFASFELGVGW